METPHAVNEPRPEHGLSPPCIFRGGARPKAKECEPCSAKMGKPVRYWIYGCAQFGNCTLGPVPLDPKQPPPAHVLPVCQSCKAKSPVLDSLASALVG